MNQVKSKSTILFFLLLITPILQILLTWGNELRVSTNIGGFGFFYSEIVYLLAFVAVIILRKKSNNPKITILILLGLFLSFLSNFANEQTNWFLRFLIGADFYFIGFLFTYIKFNQLNTKLLKFVVLGLFYFICVQQILITLGVFVVESSSVNSEQLVRHGTTVGSTIQTAYVLLIMIAILILLFKNRYILLSIHLLGTLAILLSFSRGPILSWVIVYLLFFLINLKSKKVKGVFLAMTLSLLILNANFNFISLIQERFQAEDVTSGRDVRWEKTLNIYQNSSKLFGAGSGITPSERMIKSELQNINDLSSSPHNVYLSYLVENGVIGLFIYLMLIIYLIKQVRKANKNYSVPVLIFFSLPLIYMNTEIILRSGLNAFFFWLLFHLIILKRRTNSENKKQLIINL